MTTFQLKIDGGSVNAGSTFLGLLQISEGSIPVLTLVSMMREQPTLATISENGQLSRRAVGYGLGERTARRKSAVSPGRVRG